MTFPLIDLFFLPVAQWNSETMKKIAKFTYEQSNYGKYGLYFDDVWGASHPELIPVINEAIRRFQISDPAGHDRRQFRIIRAFQLEINKDYLPQDQWITYEKDQTDGRYLYPYVEEIRREEAEKKAWNSAHA